MPVPTQDTPLQVTPLELRAKIRYPRMSDFSQLVPEYVRSLSGYTPGKSLRQAQQESHVNCIKMASNENPFGPSPKAVKAMQTALAESNFYPDNDAIELRQRLAEYHNVQPEQIVPA